MKSLFPDIVSTKLVESRDFYTALFGFRVLFEIDWYIQLEHPDNPTVQIAFVARDHESVSAPLRVDPQGIFITLETDDVDAVHARAQELGLGIVHEIRDEEFGQRRFVTRDPNGLFVDVFTLIPPSTEFARKHGLA